ncbi:putative histidine-type phosphatase [Paratrimastix pyriformis]|uniref:Histidine-type phosphatase n=1 Tax=Paratrimastix pyriformis TaxID=342808 RepID=A0ABQ8UKU4_9EUKA|nr:putative histidine-type phosphatase [Paratrimastix pyriformis]
MLARHGDREPQLQMPLDPTNWTALGELTPIGMNQHYNLGREVVGRYGEIIPRHFSDREIYIRSTNYNRALMSAYSQLQGIFPPGSGPSIEGTTTPALPDSVQVRPQQQRLICFTAGSCPQPVPIVTVPIAAEYLLRPFEICPSALGLLQGLVFERAPFASMWAAQQPLCRTLEGLTGLGPGALADPFTLTMVADTFRVARAKGRPLPAGVTDDIYNRTVTLGEAVFVACMPLEPRWFQLAMGPFADEVPAPTLPPHLYPPLVASSRARHILWPSRFLCLPLLSNMEADLAGSAARRRYRLYSAHDDTIMAYMAAVGQPLTEWLPYAANVVWELHGPDTNHSEAFVRILYNPGPSLAAPRPVPHRGCAGNECTLTQFHQALRAIAAGPGWLGDLCGVEGAPGAGSTFGAGALAATIIEAAALGAVALLSAVAWRARRTFSPSAAPRHAWGRAEF